MFISQGNKTFPSVAHALLDVWLLPLRDPTAEERRAVYERCVKIAECGISPWGRSAAQRSYSAVLLDRLTADEKAPAALAADVLAGSHACPPSSAI